MCIGDRGLLYIDLNQKSIRLGNILSFSESNNDYIQFQSSLTVLSMAYVAYLPRPFFKIQKGLILDWCGC